ncbi:hypothetical protein Avbf_03330 [Armadillidium vulgare]|nr:hypothetical protein Avbf_03330 [Armadillidium vulgare]
MWCIVYSKVYKIFIDDNGRVFTSPVFLRRTVFLMVSSKKIRLHEFLVFHIRRQKILLNSNNYLQVICLWNNNHWEKENIIRNTFIKYKNKRSFLSSHKIRTMMTSTRFLVQKYFAQSVTQKNPIGTPFIEGVSTTLSFENRKKDVTTEDVYICEDCILERNIFLAPPKEAKFTGC